MKRALALLLFVLLANAGRHHSHHSSFWSSTGPAPKEAKIPLKIFLRQRNLDHLSDLFWKVSDPKSPLYGHFLSREEITQIVSPSSESIATVLEWLLSFGASNVELVANRDAVSAVLGVERLEEMLQVQMEVFRHESGEMIVRSSAREVLPSHVSAHVDLVLGVSNFPTPKFRTQNFVVKKGQPGSVVILEALARGGSQIKVKYNVTCLDGTLSNTFPIPCSDNPPALSQLQFTITNVQDPSDEELIVVDPECTADGCTAIVKPVTYYHPYTLEVTPFFGGSNGVPSQWPFPIVATPPVVPQTLNALYKIPPNSLVTSNSSQCVVEFEQQYYSQQDLETFMQEMGLPSPAPVTVIGPNDQSNPGGEANLDIQWMMGMAPGSPTTFWSIYANSTVEIDDILSWCIAVGNDPTPPLVNSLSYGMAEDEVDKWLGPGYVARSDVEFQKLALRGVTILIADGDAGAGDLGPPPMSDTDCSVLHPDWPSQSPFVTAVGSTLITPWAEPICYLPRNEGGIDCDMNPLGEVSTSLDAGLFWTTGGGFSNKQSMPKYQKDFVNSYLDQKNFLPPGYLFNASGRAYPDVVAVGHNLMVVLGGQWIPVDGTSASAPIFGGIVTLLNDIRAINGLSPLGFLNPLLYTIAQDFPSAFFDVTVGNNRCGTIDFVPYCCDSGYQAAPGWDATSGLGSPNFEVLKEAVLKY